MIQREGYVRMRVDGETYDVSEAPELEKIKHDIAIVIDRIVVKEGIRSRLFDSFEAALRLAEGYAIVDVIGQEEMLFSEHYACPYCGFTVGELEPRLFSFNAPFGACPDCDGLGVKLEVDKDLVIPDPTKTLREGAIVPGTLLVPNIIHKCWNKQPPVLGLIWIRRLKNYLQTNKKLF